MTDITENSPQSEIFIDQGSVVKLKLNVSLNKILFGLLKH